MSNVAQLGFTSADLQIDANPTRMPASRDSIARFEQSMNTAETGIGASGVQPLQFAAAGTRAELASFERISQYADRLSENWDAGQAAIERLLAVDDLSPKDVLAVQYQLTGAMLNVELAARVGGMSEQGIQTLIQRNQ